MLTQSVVITRIVNPVVTISFILVTVLPGHAVSIFHCRSHKGRSVVCSCVHTPGEAELLPQMLPALAPSILPAENSAGRELQTRATEPGEAFCHNRTLAVLCTLAVHCTVPVLLSRRAGGIQ